jgi:hypothetical protein
MTKRLYTQLGMSKRNITIIENWKSLTSNCYGDAYMNLILWQGMASLGEALIYYWQTNLPAVFFS